MGEVGVRVFIDESLSPVLALRLNATGGHDAVHPLHIGTRGEPDHRIVSRALNEDRAIVTQNAHDFRKLLAKTDIHPGLVILPPVAREESWLLLQAAIAVLESRGDPMAVIVNHVLEMDLLGGWSLTPLP